VIVSSSNIGALRLVGPPSPTDRKPRKLVNNFVKMTGYVDKVDAMTPGSMVKFKRSDYPELANNETWKSFAASVNSIARRHFGKDKYLCAVDQENGTVEVLRVE
jgi:hypothetical protein